MGRLIAGIGSALVDILLQESEEFLLRSGAAKGGMLLVEQEAIDRVLSGSAVSPLVVPGGSACNTIAGTGRLGGPARFVGKRGDDALGEMFEAGLRQSNVEPRLFRSASATGRVLSIVTPDAQRSMLTYLGAASELSPEEITVSCLQGAALVHIEGYLLFNEALLRSALVASREAGARISLDLASYTVVEAAGDLLYEIVKDFVDVLIVNEDEARAFTGLENEVEALERMSRDVEIAVLKVGARGSFISRGGEVIRIGIVGSGEAVDTTGAGDLWAAGFLFGLVNGFPLRRCGELGAACGYEVCQILGTRIPEEGWERIRKLL